MNRLFPLAAALALTACTADQRAAVRADLAASAAEAKKLCAEVAPIVTLGDVAAHLSGSGVVAAITDAAIAVRDKCVIVIPAAQALAAGHSLSGPAATLLSDPQAIADLAADVAAVKGAVTAR